MASGAGIRLQTGGSKLMNSMPGEWREVESSPFTGKCSAPAYLLAWEHLRRSLPRHSIPTASRTTGALGRRFQGMAESIWSDGVQNQKQNQLLGRDHTASRWSAPSPGQRTRREDHALSHRPQMSSGRLFLDRVGRHQSPSPLHRRSQNNTQSPNAQAKGDISTLPGRRHFYFALTSLITGLATATKKV